LLTVSDKFIRLPVIHYIFITVRPTSLQLEISGTNNYDKSILGPAQQWT